MFSYFKHKPTLLEVKKDWAVEHYPRLSTAGVKSYEMSFKYCKDLYDVPFKDIKYRQWQSIVQMLHNRGLHYGSQKKLKNLAGQLCKYAIKNEIATTDYAPMLEIDHNIPVFPREPFSEEEIEILWNNIDIPHVDLVIMLIYTGVRISEFMRIEVDNDVFINDDYFIVRKSKTLAGRNRPVPIHRLIKPFFVKHMNDGGKLLIVDNGKPINYSKFHSWFMQLMRRLHLSHRIHECRHTLATLLDNAGANDTATRKILGHACNGVTKQVYTHKKIDDLKYAMNLIQRRNVHVLM